MSSPIRSYEEETPDDQPKAQEQISFRFCRECSNMLYPKEDRMTSKLMFACRTCQFSEEAQSSCVFRNNMYNTVGETAGVTQDVGSDPTVGCCLLVSDRELDLREQALVLPMCCLCGCAVGDEEEDEGYGAGDDVAMDVEEEEESDELSRAEKHTKEGRSFNMAWTAQMEEEEQAGAAEDDDEGFESGGGDDGAGAQMTARIPPDSALTD